MTDGVTALQAQVESFFTERFAAVEGTIGAETRFFAFSSLGTGQPPDEFKISPGDTALSNSKAIEVFSNLVDFVSPVVEDDIVPLSLLSFDQQHQALVEASQPVTALGPQWVEVFNDIKTAAKLNLSTTRITYEGGLDYHASFATPRQWYDPAAREGWSRCALSSREGPPPPAPSGPKLKTRPEVWNWRLSADQQVKEAPGRRFVSRADRSAALHVLPIEVETGARSPAVEFWRRGAEARHLSGARLRGLTRALGEGTRSEAREAVFTRRGGGRPWEVELHGAGGGVAVEGTGASSEPAPQASSPNLEISKIAFDADFLKYVAQLQEQPVASNSVDIAFEYLTVSIDRPWLAGTLLHSDGWYMPGSRAGSLCSGEGEAANGLCPAIPIAFIAVRNLTLSGRWSEADRQILSRAAGFGPFYLGSSYDETRASITCPGLQIVAWLCQVLPKLPPQSDPNLPSA
jgi:hypothetical protein